MKRKLLLPGRQGGGILERDTSDRHLLYDDVVSGLTRIFSESFKNFDYDVLYGFADQSDNSKTVYDTFHPVGSRGYAPMEVYIGRKSLMENIDSDSRVRDVDAVRTFMHGFHECAHVWERGVGYMRSPDTAPHGIKNMARDRALSICFPSYGKMIYLLDSAELMADLDSVRGVKSFFRQMSTVDDRYAAVDLNGIVSDIAKDRHGITWREFQSCKSVNDVELTYGKAVRDAPYRRRFVLPYLEAHRKEDPHMDRLLRDTDLVSAIVNAPSGLEQTDMLCQYAGKNHPDCFRSLPCIRSEYAVTNIRNIGESAVSHILNVSAKYDAVKPERPDHDSENYGPDV